jgi:hypothetical protein
LAESTSSKKQPSCGDTEYARPILVSNGEVTNTS